MVPGPTDPRIERSFQRGEMKSAELLHVVQLGARLYPQPIANDLMVLGSLPATVVWQLSPQKVIMVQSIKLDIFQELA